MSTDNQKPGGKNRGRSSGRRNNPTQGSGRKTNLIQVNQPIGPSETARVTINPDTLTWITMSDGTTRCAQVAHDPYTQTVHIRSTRRGAKSTVVSLTCAEYTILINNGMTAINPDITKTTKTNNTK